MKSLSFLSRSTVICAFVLLPVAVPALTLSTQEGGGADLEFRENLNNSVFTESTSDSTSQNTRTSSGGDRNEVVGLKFDLSGYTLADLTDVTLNLYAHRLDNSTRQVTLYGVVQGTVSGTGNFTTETWNETATLYGDLPGLLASDGDCSTQNLNGGSLVPLGSYSIGGGQPEGTVHTLGDAAITTFVQGYGGSSLVTFVLVAGSTSTGQFRTATRETTTTATGVLSGVAGDFAPFLQFSVTPSSKPLVLDYAIANDGQGIEFSWPAGFVLQYQSNGLNTGLGSTWAEYPASNSPVQVSVDRALGTMFFRLAQAP